MKLPKYDEIGVLLDTWDTTTPIPEYLMAAIRRLLVFSKDRVKFAFNDPPRFNQTGTVNPEVFIKVLEQLRDPDGLAEDKLIQLINTFCAKCSAEDWHNFYQPVFQRRPDHKLTITGVNRFLSDQYRIKLFVTPKPVPGFPTDVGRFYQFDPAWKRFYGVVVRNNIHLLDETFGSDYPEDAFEIFSDPAGFPVLAQSQEMPIAFEMFWDGNDLILTDVFGVANISTWPGVLRREVLEAAYVTALGVVDGIVLGEGVPGGPDKDLLNLAEHLRDLDYDGYYGLFKSDMGPYTQPAVFVKLPSLE